MSTAHSTCTTKSSGKFKHLYQDLIIAIFQTCRYLYPVSGHLIVWLIIRPLCEYIFVASNLRVVCSNVMQFSILAEMIHCTVVTKYWKIVFTLAMFRRILNSPLVPSDSTEWLTLRIIKALKPFSHCEFYLF